MMYFATLPWLALLLIAQQALSRPADSADNEAIAQTDNNIFSEDTRDVPETRPSQLDPPDSYEARGLLANLFGSSGAAGSQKPNKITSESQTPNKLEERVGQQSATIISATTHPEGSKPVDSPKPATGQESPTGIIGQQPPSQSKPPGSSLNGAILSSLFGFPVAAGSQQPNKPISPEAGFSQLGSSFSSSSSGTSPDSSATFPGSMAGFMQYMLPPPPPMMFGNPFSGSGSHFEGLESPFGSGAGVMTQTGPTTSHQGNKIGNGFSLPQLLALFMRSIETPSEELSTS